MSDELSFLATRHDIARPQTEAEMRQELDLLRKFFESWEALHGITGDKRNPDIRRQAENAAQALIDAAQPLRILRKQHAH